MNTKVIFFGFVVFLNLFGYGLLSPFLPIFMRSNQLSTSEIGATIGVYSLITILLAGLVGHLSDKIGRTKLLSLGVLLYLCFLLLISTSKTFVAFIFSYIILGIGNTLFWVCSRSYILDLGESFIKFLMFFGVMGSTFGILFGGFLISSVGYLNSFYIASFITLSAFLLSLFNKEIKKERVKNIIKFKYSNQTLVLISIIILTMLFVNVFTIFLPLYFKEILNFKEYEIGISLFFITISWSLSQLLVGKIFEKLKIKIGLAIGYLIWGSSIYFLLLMKDIFTVVISGIFSSFGRAFYDIGTMIYTRRIFGNRRGLGAGILETFSNVGLVLGSFIGGFLIQFFGYINTFYFLILVVYFVIILVYKIKK